LRPHGLSVKAEKHNDTHYVTIKTPDNTHYQLRKFNEKNAPGFHAAALAVHPVQNNVVSKKPNGINFAFGGTVTLWDIPRTLNIHVTQSTRANEILLANFLKQSLEKYKENYPNQPVPRHFTLVAHSAGAQTALKAADMIFELIPNAQITTTLCEPFGGKFIPHNHRRHKSITSYFSERSFLNKLTIPGAKAVGREIILPTSTETNSQNPIHAHRMIDIFKTGFSHRVQKKRGQNKNNASEPSSNGTKSLVLRDRNITNLKESANNRGR
ncbi:MAG: hypothetical protein MK137_10145, partial [Rickettsiales bacterium]|nr:hypothetical protein [Rickettsiales bacterium]